MRIIAGSFGSKPPFETANQLNKDEKDFYYEIILFFMVDIQNYIRLSTAHRLQCVGACG